jgi:CelD/BcsL family acetyltransferase involved in cellulose biosynthesis
MLFPFQIERRLGVSIARWIGEPMTQYGDALAEAGEGRARWRKAAEAAMARWRDVDLFALTRLRADGVLAEGPVSGEALSAPYVELRVAKLRRHKSLERRAKRLEAHGAVALDEARSPAERESVARHAFALKREWLDGKGVFSAGLSNPASEGFIASLAREGFLRVNMLRVGGEIAAIDVGFIGGGAYRSLMGCYDARFAEGSPGQALTGRLIAHCRQEGLSAYDMLLPADAYKLDWASGEIAVNARLVATSLKGHVAAFALARLRPLAKRIVHGLAPLRARAKAPEFSFPSNPASLSPSRREGTAS